MIKKIISAFPLLLCLISLLYPPYIEGDVTIIGRHPSIHYKFSTEESEYAMPIYKRDFLLYHHKNFNDSYWEHDFPERINIIQLACELSASIILFFLIKNLLKE